MSISKENINELIYNVPPIDDMWCVSVVWVDAFGGVESTYCYFYDRYIAEKWLSDFVRDGRPYYAKCCGDTYYSKLNELTQF